ncbi:hypothetical protein SUDANB1_00105 [Streptomyces sp. enrichment culture]
MPSDSTLDSAPKDASQHPAAEPFEALLAPSVDAPQAGALDQSGYGGPAAPMDTLDLDPCVVPPLDDGVLNSGSVADVVDTASSVFGISDFVEPRAYLGSMVGEFTERASFLAPVIAGIDPLVPRLPNIGEVVGKSLLDGLGDHNAGLSAVAGVQPHVLSLSQSVNSLRRSSAVGTLGLPDGRNPARAMLPGVEPQIIPRLVPWAQQFETESVQYVVGRFNEQEQAVLRVWAENHPMPWTKAPAWVQQDEAQGGHNRRKLKRVAKEWRRHEINRRELP